LIGKQIYYIYIGQYSGKSCVLHVYMHNFYIEMHNIIAIF